MSEAHRTRVQLTRGTALESYLLLSGKLVPECRHLPERMNEVKRERTIAAHIAQWEQWGDTRKKLSDKERKELEYGCFTAGIINRPPTPDNRTRKGGKGNKSKGGRRVSLDTARGGKSHNVAPNPDGKHAKATNGRRFLVRK